ncbi:MAG: hypothetical protein Kow0058_07040 [Roseovarius sp.]
MNRSMMILAGILAALGGPALAGRCAPHELVVSQLAERFGESRQSMGLAGQEMVIEIFASLETGTWTITVTDPLGMTCLLASGEAFAPVAEALPAPGNDA